MRKRGWIIIISIFVLGIFLYPYKVILVPAMELTIRYEDGRVVSNAEVSRDWNHYLGPGWTAAIRKTDSNGIARFNEVSRRMSIFYLTMSYLGTHLSMHEYPGYAGSIKAYDADNHFIWNRVDFSDRDCCPTEVTLALNEEEIQYFTFGHLNPDE